MAPQRVVSSVTLAGDWLARLASANLGHSSANAFQWRSSAEMLPLCWELSVTYAPRGEIPGVGWVDNLI